MSQKDILHVIQKDKLKDISQTSQSPLGTLGATLYTNSRAMGGIFYKVPGKQGVYRLRVGTVSALK
uniref:HTH HARE-type domain-containing protein n=1 Tax=Eptatretus burgeri TaxID=7764 RepID=A0A8C4QZY6_EPTBU